MSQWLASVDLSTSSPQQQPPPSDVDLEAQLNHVVEVEAEMAEWTSRVHDTVSLGRDLISEIQSENDYPEDYLKNVNDKVELVSRELSRLEIQVPETKRNLSYWLKKAQLRSNLQVLSRVLDQYEAKLSGKEGDRGGGGAGRGKGEMQSYKANLAMHNQSLQHLKTLAKETLLHPGAIIDPGNTIKSDLYNFVERFEALETKFSVEEKIDFEGEQKEQIKSSILSESEVVTHDALSGMKQCAVIDKDVIVVLQDVPLMEEQLKSDSGLLSREQSNLLREMVEQLKVGINIFQKNYKLIPNYSFFH